MEKDLQFERADYNAPASASCGQCGSPLVGHYYQCNGAMLCDRCTEGLRAALGGQGSSGERFGKAVIYGLGAAIVGAIIYHISLHYINLALVTILIGWMVGKMVRKGSGDRGGWRYQILAVVLTYLATAAAFTAFIFQTGEVAPQINPFLLLSALAFPITYGIESPISLLITGFGLWQAFSMTKGVKIDITGPHQLAGSPA